MTSMIKDKCLRCGYSEFKRSLTEHHLNGNRKEDLDDNKINSLLELSYGVSLREMEIKLSSDQFKVNGDKE